MLSERVLFAINDVDDPMLDAVSRRMEYSLRRRTKASRGKTLRKVFLLAAVVAVFLAFGVTAYALNLWGIREMYKTPHRQLPTEAEELIETRSETAEAKGWSCRITESLCDGSQVLVTVTVSGGEKYIIAPTDAMLEDPLWVIGVDGEGTLEDYAAEQGKELLFVGAYVQGNEETGISGASMRFESLSDSEMVILASADRDPTRATGDLVDAICVVTAVQHGAAGPADVERVEIPFAMTEGVSTLVGTFVPVDPDAVPGVHVGEATVIKTTLGYVIRFQETPTDLEEYYNILKSDYDEIDLQRSYTSQDEESENWRIHEGPGTIESTLTLHYYDENKQLIGDVVFKKAN